MIKIEKSRHGTTAKQALVFDGKHMTFMERYGVNSEEDDGFIDVDDDDLPFD